MDIIGLAATIARQPLRLARLAVDAAETVYRTVTDQPSAGPPPSEQRGPARPPAATSPPPPVVPSRRSRPAAPPRPRVPPKAKVIDDEPVLVEEFADKGAEDAPGPEIHVDEPFEGYSLLKASDLIARLSSATAEEAAAIELYEGTTKGRATVLRAAEMRLAKVGARPRI